MFGATHRIPLPGTPVSIAAGKFDHPTLAGLAVPDYDNRRVYMYHNNGAARTFSLISTLNTGFRPNVVKFFDMDGDSNLDLIVGGDTTAVAVFWGNGAGGFPTSTTVGTFGGVMSLEPIFAATVAITETRDPSISFLGFLQRKSSLLGPRVLCHNVLQRTEGLFSVPDTIPTTMYDIAVADFDADTLQDAFAIGLGPVGAPYVLFDSFIPGVVIGGEPCAWAFAGNHVNRQSGSGPNGGHSSNIVVGRFDADTDLDVVTTGASSLQCVLHRNQGGLNFAVEPIAINSANGIAGLDYENDGDLDVVTMNRFLDDNGVTVLLNDGTGQFRPEFNCYQRFASGVAFGVVPSDFDLDGKTDIAIASSFDTVFVLYNFGNVTYVGGESASFTPSMFSLGQNYPNPFNPTTRIRFTVARTGLIELKVYNILGQEVATLFNDMKNPGTYEVSWDAVGMASGVYFYRLRAGGFAVTKKLVLLR